MKIPWRESLLVLAGCVTAACTGGPETDVSSAEQAASSSPFQVKLVRFGTAAVGTPHRVDVEVTNTSQDFLYGVTLRIVVEGDARPRGLQFGAFEFYCNPDGPLSVQCDSFDPIPPGETFTKSVLVGAIGPGTVKVKATATPETPELGAPRSASLSFTAVHGTGVDLQLYLPEPGRDSAFQSEPMQDQLGNYFHATIVNASNQEVHDITVRFEVLEGSVLFAADNPGPYVFKKYMDIFAGGDEVNAARCEADDPGVVICTIDTLREWQQLYLDMRFWPDAAGPLGISAEVFAAEADPLPANNHAEVWTTVEPTRRANINTTQRVLTADPTARQPVAFEWTVTNTGPDEVDVIASWAGLGTTDLTFLQGGFGDGYCDVRGNGVYCVLTAMAVGETRVMRIDTLPPGGGDYLSYASVAATRWFGVVDIFDPDTSDNTSDLTTPLAGPKATLIEEELGWYVSRYIDCLGEDGFFTGTAQKRTRYRLKLDEQDPQYGTFRLRSKLTATSGEGTTYDADFNTRSWELVSGTEKVKNRLVVKPRRAGETYRVREELFFVERLSDGSEGMTLRFLSIYKWVSDEIGRTFVVRDVAVIECL